MTKKIYYVLAASELLGLDLTREKGAMFSNALGEVRAGPLVDQGIVTIRKFVSGSKIFDGRIIKTHTEILSLTPKGRLKVLRYMRTSISRKVTQIEKGARGHDDE